METGLSLGPIAGAGLPGLIFASGDAIGLIFGAAVCALTYLGLLSIPSRYLFTVTNTMIALLAAGMAAQAVYFLQQANVVTILDTTVWDTSWILTEKSLAGRALHTLIGYTDQPTALQLIVYLASLAAIYVLMKIFAPLSASTHATRA